MKDNYIRYVIAQYLADGNFDSAFDDRWVDEDQLVIIKSKVSLAAFAPYGIDAAGKYQDIVEGLFAALIHDGAIAIHGDEYSGAWYQLITPRKAEVVKSLIAANPVAGTVQALPEAALARALTRIAAEDGLGHRDDAEREDISPVSDWSDAVVAPASDRVVTLNHNQISEMEKPLSDIIDVVEKSNGDPDIQGIRERIIGQLRAGRELINSGTVKAYLLYSVLMTALVEVAARNKGTVIEATINALIELLINNVFSGG